MRLGETYTLTIGKYSDKYMVTAESYNNSSVLRRMGKTKSKIDALRLPEVISIIYFGTPLGNKTEKK